MGRRCPGVPRLSISLRERPDTWHLSFSRLQRYEQCPRSFKLHYVDGLACESGPELHFGKAMHRALERLVAEHARTLDPAALSLERAERLWQQAWAESGVVGIGPFYEGLKMLGTFVRSEGVVDPVSVLAVEREFEIAVGQLSLYSLAARELWPWAETVELELDMLRHDVRLRTTRTDADLDAARRYIEALGERTVNTPDVRDIAAVAREREEVACIAKVTFARKVELEALLKARLADCETVNAAGMRYQVAISCSLSYPLEATLEAVEEATALPRDTLVAKLATIDKESLATLLEELAKRLPKSRVTMLRAHLAAVAERTLTPRFSARRVRA